MLGVYPINLISNQSIHTYTYIYDAIMLNHLFLVVFNTVMEEILHQLVDGFSRYNPII